MSIVSNFENKLPQQLFVVLNLTDVSRVLSYPPGGSHPPEIKMSSLISLHSWCSADFTISLIFLRTVSSEFSGIKISFQLDFFPVMIYTTYNSLVIWVFFLQYVIHPILQAFVCLVTQSGPTLCNPLDCSPPGSPVHGDSPGKNTGVGSHPLLQGIFPIQGSILGLLHWRWIIYHPSHQGSLCYQLYKYVSL